MEYRLYKLNLQEYRLTILISYGTIHDQTKFCNAECIQIKSPLDRLEDYKPFISKHIVIDNPQFYLYQSTGQVLHTTPLYENISTHVNNSLSTNNTNVIVSIDNTKSEGGF